MLRFRALIALAVLAPVGVAAAPAAASKTKVSYRTGKAFKVDPGGGYLGPEVRASCRSKSDKALTAGWSGLPVNPSVTRYNPASFRPAESIVEWVGGAMRTSTARAGVLCAKGSKVKLKRRSTYPQGKVSCGKDYAIGNPVGPNSAREGRQSLTQGRYFSRPSGTHGWVSDLTLEKGGLTDVNCVSRKAFSGLKIVREKRSLSGTTTKVTAGCPRSRTVIGWGVDLPYVPSNVATYNYLDDDIPFGMTVMQAAKPTNGNRGWSVTFATPDAKPFVTDALQTPDYLFATVYAVCAKPG